MFTSDINGDGHVDAWDMGVQAFGAAPAAKDLNGDGVINGFDTDLLSANVR